MNEKNEMLDLINVLNHYTEEYDKGTPLISDEDWDNLYFKLVDLEKQTGIYLENSPTQKINYTVVNSLNKVTHSSPMLSLDKTKDLNAFISYFTNHKMVTMLKLDGLTCRLTYHNGELVAAETRGDGNVGEDIFHNAQVVKTIPKRINFKSDLIVDGEVICTYSNFEPFSSQYKNPRNFASGSIRLLDAKECEKRNLTFLVWNIVSGLTEPTFVKRLQKVESLGFSTVPYQTDFTDERVLTDMAVLLGCPIDGLVGRFDDIEYGKSLGSTEHHFKDAYAFKFYDETYPTKLKDIEWTMGRTGVLTPVAIFEPIDIDGTTIEKASLHNVSIMRELLGECAYEGERLEVFKANMIVPQIKSASPHMSYQEIKDTDRTSVNNFLDICPCCGEKVELVESDSGVLNFVCPNPACEGKLVNRLDHYCSKKGLDIKGLSKATLEKLINWGWVKDIRDLYTLQLHSIEWSAKEGFGEKSVTKILDAIKQSKKCYLSNFIAALGIPLVGLATAKILCEYYPTWEEFQDAVNNKDIHFWDIKGFGTAIDDSLKHYDYTFANEIVNEFITFQNEEKIDIVSENCLTLADKNIVVTGKLNHFKNRDALKAEIIKRGGKVTDSVSSKTSILVNNDINSTSAKNKKAKDLGIPIVTEEDFMHNFLT